MALADVNDGSGRRFRRPCRCAGARDSLLIQPIICLVGGPPQLKVGPSSPKICRQTVYKAPPHARSRGADRITGIRRLMYFPPPFLDEIRARITASTIIGRRVSWDRRKSNPSRGDWWGCCPFHNEKT